MNTKTEKAHIWVTVSDNVLVAYGDKKVHLPLEQEVIVDAAKKLQKIADDMEKPKKPSVNDLWSWWRFAK